MVMERKSDGADGVANGVVPLVKSGSRDTDVLFLFFVASVLRQGFRLDDALDAVKQRI